MLARLWLFLKIHTVPLSLSLWLLHAEKSRLRILGSAGVPAVAG